MSVAISVMLFMGAMQINDTIHREKLEIIMTLIAKSHKGAAPIFSVMLIATLTMEGPLHWAVAIWCLLSLNMNSVTEHNGVHNYSRVMLCFLKDSPPPPKETVS